MFHLRIRPIVFALLAATTVLWISGTLAQDPTSDPAPNPHDGATSSGTQAPSRGANSSSSTSSSSGYSSATATSDGETSNYYYMYGTGTSEPDPLRQADQRFAQSTRDLIAKYGETTDSGERETIRDQLNDVLTKHFEVRQQIRESELEELEAQVQRLRELHNRREQAKDQIVRDRLQQLLRDAEGLGWGSDDAIPEWSAGGYGAGSRSIIGQPRTANPRQR